MRNLYLSFWTTLCCSILSAPGFAQDKSHKIWFTIEDKSVDAQLCHQKNVCRPVSRYVTKLAEKTNKQGADAMFTSLSKLAQQRGFASKDIEAPQMCKHVEAAKILGFDPEQWPESEKLDTLKGLQGVYVSLDNLKGPKDHTGPFGLQIQASVEKRFAAAGIPILTEEERDNTPGKPHLNVYFSNTNPDTGCWFSVFSSLTQTALLTRNHTVKFKAGTWGFSGGYSAENPERSEFDAILMVIDKFIADFKTANPNGIQRMSQTKP